MAASEKRRISAAEVEPLGSIGSNPRIGEQYWPSLFCCETQFDALHAKKYAHVYDQSAIAD